jgi:ClpP class serine protease
MKLINLDHRINHSAWYIIPSYFQSLRDAVESYQSETLPILRSADMEDIFGFLLNQRPPMTIDENGIARISISGAMGRGCSQLEKLLGLTDYGDLTDEVEEALAQKAKGFFFDVDSPGGTADGCPEAAAFIASITKPKVSFSCGMDCSAAYFLSSSMDKKFASPSALTGSIGTIVPWVDKSVLWDAMGLSWDPVTGAGEDLKGAGMGPSLTTDQREYIQDRVNAMSTSFRDHVSAHRSVPFNKLKAGSFGSQQALDFNLIDKIGTADQAYSWLKRKI